MSDSYLAITAMGRNQLGLTDGLTDVVLECGCNINDSRMAVLGDEYAALMLISGNWNSVAKLEALVPKLADRLSLAIQTKRTEPRQASNDIIPYGVEVVALDHPGIVYDISNFFYVRQISIEDLYSTVYQAPHTGAKMFSLHMTVGIPADTAIAAIRGEFMDFCDDRNLDAMLAPVK